MVAVFQPHLYSRTRYLHKEFARALLEADVCVVTDVYGAREDPEPGVSGKLIVDSLLRLRSATARGLPAPTGGGGRVSASDHPCRATWCSPWARATCTGWAKAFSSRADSPGGPARSRRRSPAPRRRPAPLAQRPARAVHHHRRGGPGGRCWSRSGPPEAVATALDAAGGHRGALRRVVGAGRICSSPTAGTRARC